MAEPKLGAVEGQLRPPAVENPALVEEAVLGGLMENLILSTVMDLIIFSILGQDGEPVPPEQIKAAFEAAIPEIQTALLRRGVGEHPSGELASLLQRTKGGRTIYANVSLEILPPVMRSGIPVTGLDPFLKRTEMHVTGVKLGTSDLATKTPLKLSIIDESARREGVLRVISIPIHEPNAIAPELLPKGDIV